MFNLVYMQFSIALEPRAGYRPRGWKGNTFIGSPEMREKKNRSCFLKQERNQEQKANAT